MSGSLRNCILSGKINTTALLDQVRKERAERSLAEFIRQAWSVLEPNTPYVHNWHIDLIAEYLQAVNDGEIHRLLINMPPRHMKSIEATICYPVWTWTRHPEKRFIKVSYSDSLSREHNVRSRDIVLSNWYQGNWGNVFSLKDDVNRQNEFQNDHMGLMLSTSTGGALTGKGGDVIIIDDPQNPAMANSEAEQQTTIDFFRNTLQTRLNNPKKGAFIIIMQRLHENDLSGYILSENLGYTHLCLPAEAPERVTVSFPKSGKTIVRESGDILNPGRFDKTVLDGLKKSLGSLQYAGQFQQVPAPAEGVIFKREWLEHRFWNAELPYQSLLIQSWDMAFTKSEGSAKVAGFVMGRSGSDIYLLDLVNEKMDFVESVAAVRRMSEKWPKASAKVIENKANGPAIVNFLEKEIPGMIEFNPDGKKEERALSVTPYFENGNIRFPYPKEAPWVEELTRDLLIFPKGQYKDTVDALVQGVLYLMRKPIMAPPPKDMGGFMKGSYWRG